MKGGDSGVALAEGIASGLVAAAVIYFVLRFDPRTVPGYIVTAALIDAAENAALAGTSTAWTAFAFERGGERRRRIRGDALPEPAARSLRSVALVPTAVRFGHPVSPSRRRRRPTPSLGPLPQQDPIAPMWLQRFLRSRELFVRERQVVVTVGEAGISSDAPSYATTASTVRCMSSSSTPRL